MKISEGFRIPANFESESQDKFGIVKQYQFSKYTPIKKGVFVSEKNISRVVSENSERYKNSLKEKRHPIYAPLFTCQDKYVFLKLLQ